IACGHSLALTMNSTLNSAVLGQNTHKWREHATCMLAKRFEKGPERRDLQRQKMRRLKTKNRAGDVPLSGDCPMIDSDPVSPAEHNENFLDKLLWENAARSDMGDYSLLNYQEDVETSRTYTVHPRSSMVDGPTISRYQSMRDPITSRYHSTASMREAPVSSVPDIDFSLTTLCLDGLHSVSIIAQYLLEDPMILIALGCSILLMVVVNA
ncbi:hypothetical protein PFISCL1PPCAC_11440, partial [Pristionchus fissidentatus]